MPKFVRTTKEFVTLCSRTDAKWVKIKENGDSTKFKLRTSKYLYTVKVDGEKMKELLKGSIPQNLEVIVLDSKKE